jgi:hypothetical protein
MVLYNHLILHPRKKGYADVAKLVDALDLGSSAARHGGSSPSIRTDNLKVKSSRNQPLTFNFQFVTFDFTFLV